MHILYFMLCYVLMLCCVFVCVMGEVVRYGVVLCFGWSDLPNINGMLDGLIPVGVLVAYRRENLVQMERKGVPDVRAQQPIALLLFEAILHKKTRKQTRTRSGLAQNRQRTNNMNNTTTPKPNAINAKQV